MKSISPVLILLKLFLLLCVQISSVYANTVAISENGKVATLTLPLKAAISDNDIIRNAVRVIPLSSVYEHIKWDKAARKLPDHHFLLRVVHDKVSALNYEIINDAYTCSYNNLNRLEALPQGISVVNDGYSYSITAGTNTQDLGSGRSATINETSAWLPAQGTADYFIDLMLNITFPDISKHEELMSKGGFCRGSVTMLVSTALAG
ncbi:hypothetical protein SIL91_005000 [Salmonella enterica]|nr:hypothetical protein [Salmonella enterica]ELW8656385.1 hypothetical protein [Salmonella enterica]